MKVVTPAQMNAIDSMCINHIGIPGIVLMENAALKVVDEITESLQHIRGKKIYIFAGKGNNGGDAFAAARHLYNGDAKIKVYLLSEKKNIGGDAGVNLAVLEKMGIDVIELTDELQLEVLERELLDADMVIDGIFGTGLKGKITGLIEAVIRVINNSGRNVVSIDIPSGVSGETGAILGCCIKACKTVSFGLPKIGMIVHPGCEYTGELITVDIGIPAKAIEGTDIRTNIIEDNFVSKLIPRRYRASNKGDYGRVLIISGSVGMTGAGCLVAGAALRTGAGLVYLGVPSTLVPVYDASLIESITLPLEDNGLGYISKDSIKQILGHLKRVTVVAVGPGLSVNDDIVEIVSNIIANSEAPLILDADALNAVSRDVSVLKKLKAEAVITPHPGEMARLTGLSVKDVQDNRIEIAREFAAKWNIITVLKGAKTIIASPDGTIYINVTGNPGMATGGTGDVLTGVIAGLIGQGAKPLDAAVAGVYLHGLAGDSTAVMKGEHGLIAGDLLEELPYIIKGLTGNE